MKTILLIEDEDSIRLGFKALLDAEGFRTLDASNGETGAQLAREHLPDLIICDVNMPGMNGYEVLTFLRQDDETSAIPFIFLTAKTDRSDLRHGMTLGADDFITKPCTREELLDAIATRLSRQTAITQPLSRQLKLTEDKLKQLLHYDDLTGLPNRMMLRQILNASIGEARKAETPLAVLSVDLDHFSRIYETLSHQFTDLLLQVVAGRLASVVAGEENQIARLSEDQFIVLLTNVPTRENAARVVSKMLQIIARPYTLEGQQAFVTCSIGIALYPENGSGVDELIRNAEAAMRQAKNQGGNQYHWYTPDLHARSAELMELENGLRYALERQEFVLAYQPQVDLRTGQIVGAEALLRWPHGGNLSPSIFIPVAEKSDLILPIDEWVLRAACAQAASWRGAGFEALRIAVNLSARQFSQKDLAGMVKGVLEDTGFDPSGLEIEITESTLMRDAESAERTLHELKSMGIRISIDDFGTGYSSLGYLKSFPFDVLKIDRMFVKDITVDSKNAAITMAMIQMAHDLNLIVIAEGVETAGELLFLQLHQCDLIQGYLFSTPVPVAEFESLMKSGKRLHIQHLAATPRISRQIAQ
jgi:diguanylate cyclase (GGDEF)-like protein